jgi:DNA invertase Pin-like site-specific DNA recombinase
MALVGYGRVSTDKQKTERQRDALNAAGVVRIFEEKISGTLKVEKRPALAAAIDYMRDEDMLCVQEADRLGRSLLDGLLTLAALFERGVRVRILEGIAAGDHSERTFVLDLALALAEDRRRDIVRKTKNGLEAARVRGRVGGRRPVVDDDKRTVIFARRAKGESLNKIAAAVGVSKGTVHNTLNRPLDG